MKDGREFRIVSAAVKNERKPISTRNMQVRVLMSGSVSLSLLGCVCMLDTD